MEDGVGHFSEYDEVFPCHYMTFLICSSYLTTWPPWQHLYTCTSPTPTILCTYTTYYWIYFFQSNSFYSDTLIILQIITCTPPAFPLLCSTLFCCHGIRCILLCNIVQLFIFVPEFICCLTEPETLPVSCVTILLSSLLVDIFNLTDIHVTLIICYCVILKTSNYWYLFNN